MLIVVQFPIADTRGFVPDSVSKLELPDWPAPSVDLNPQFARSFGPAVRRRRRADAAWLDERYFFEAGRGLRLPGFGRLPFAIPHEEPLDRKRGLRDPTYTASFTPSIAFRRLLYDGLVVGRVEVGIGQSEHSVPIRALKGGEFFALLQHVLASPSEVPQGGTASIERALVFQGRHLASLFEFASTRAHATDKLPTGLVEAGTPLVVVEYTGRDILDLPRGARILDPATVNGAHLAFCWLRISGASIPTWFIRTTKSAASQRSLRLCLLRLHAEREALDLVLRQLRRGRIPFDVEREESDRLQDYLNRATRMVQREWVSGIQQSEVLAAFDAANHVLRHGDGLGLLERLSESRLQVLRKVQRYEENRAYSRIIHVGTYVKGDYMEHNELNITGSTILGAVNNKVAADTIQNSFNTVSAAQIDSGLREALTMLSDEVKTLVRQMEDNGVAAEKVADTARLLEVFAAQAIESRPLSEVLLGAGRGLVNAAAVVSERVAPIAGAINAVLGLLGVAGVNT